MKRSSSDNGQNIRIENVYKSFGDAQAVRGLNLEIYHRELLVLLGPSGCGKTTTMNMLAGLEEPTKGEIYFGEKNVTRIPAEERDIAMVFQTFALYPHLNVYENIGFSLKLRGASKQVIQERVREVTNMLHIEKYLNRKVTELSGGERQRVAIAKALVRRPFLFLLDEPFSNIDAIMRREFRAELSRIHTEVQTTMLFVTHDQEEAMSLADRIAVMRSGELMQVGPPLDLHNKPANLWVARFIGAHPINVMDCQLAGKGEPAQILGGAAKTLVSDGFYDRVRAATSARDIVLGVRPEFVQICSDPTSATPIRGRVFTRQILGNQILYDVEVNSHHLRVFTSAAQQFAVDQPVCLEFTWDGVMAFDKQTEQCIVN